MKKALISLLIVLLVIAIAVAAWLIGYHSHKSLDNIPSKANMVAYLQEKGEAYATERIAGYSFDALTEIWGEPDGELFGMYGRIWEAERTYFIVYFDTDGCAVDVKLGTED